MGKITKNTWYAIIIVIAFTLLFMMMSLNPFVLMIPIIPGCAFIWWIAKSEKDNPHAAREREMEKERQKAKKDEENKENTESARSKSEKLGI